MKKMFPCLLIAFLFLCSSHYSYAQFFKKLKEEIKNNNTNKSTATTKTNSTATTTPATTTANPAATASNATANPAAGDTDIKVYNNYDFVPGQNVLFEDHFTNEDDGEFPSQWKLERGQGVMNKYMGTNSLLLTDGNYAIVSPRVKSPAYLTDPFTFEMDYFVSKQGGPGLVLRITNPSKTVDIHVYNDGNTADDRLNGTYPGNQRPEAFRNKWHHIAIAYKKNQVKIYVDQYRVMVDPDFGDILPATLMVCSIGSLQDPFIFSNVRIASGGGMNMIGKKFTDAKIITHGINFDYNKASIRPESMGTLNMIVKIMTGDPDVKFEVGGHTDGDGDDAYNLTLSQQRADAVRTQLISMGIDGARLTAKGYGKTKPIADNTTEEGKANNRRVEFVKN